MSIMTLIQHVHELDTWVVYPRVQYFRRRFIDLHRRFSKTAEAFPKSFHDEKVLDQLRKLYTTLRNLPRILVSGDDIPIEYGIGVQYSDSDTADKLEVKIFSLKDLQLEHWKQYQESFQTKADESGVRTNLDIIVVGDCSSKITDEVKQRAETIRTWLIKVGVEVPILVYPKLTELSGDIEKVLETYIMQGFENMFTYMQHYFIRKSIKCDIGSEDDILNKKTIFTALNDTLHDKDLSEIGTDEPDFFPEIIGVVCKKIQCSIVPNLAAIYKIPEFLCFQLLVELHFKERIFDVVEENSISYEDIISQEAQTQHINIKALRKYAYQMHCVIKDVCRIHVDLERSLLAAQQVTKVMKKMTLEIRGYSKQSLVHSKIIEYEISPPKISDKLRKDILSIENVYALGTIWGELEIHLKPQNEKSDTEMKKEVNEQIKKHQFFYPYYIRTLEQHPKLFFRQGDKILSPCLDDRLQVRTGSVGCFVCSSQGVPHCLTCAHVVDPGRKQKHVVQIERSVDGQIKVCRYGLSKPQKTVCSGYSMFPVIDIAAVEASDDDKIRLSVNYNLRNDFEDIKPVSFVCDLSESLLNTPVYKFGAATSLTHGVICSVDLCSHQAENYLMLVDDPPEINEQDQDLNVFNEGVVYQRVEPVISPINDDENMQPTQKFAEKGDSGAVICSNDFSADPKGTILAVSMLVAGEYKTNESPKPKCCAFLLAKGLEILASRGHFYTM